MENLNASLTQSFAANRGVRGVHFYDETQCEFMIWSDVMDKTKEKFPEAFYNKLIDAVANFDPEEEFVTVTAGSGEIVIELFKITTV